MIRLYARLLRLYPAAFRQRFAPEMTAVFAAALADARQEGPLAVARLCLGELWALPHCIVREHLHERGSGVMSGQPLAVSEKSARLRRLARSLSLVIAAPILVAVFSPAPPHWPALIVLLLVIGSIATAWFREDVGGRLLTGSGVLLGVTVALSFITGSGVPSHPVPGREVMILLTGAGIGLLAAALVAGTGLLFVRVARWAARPEAASLPWFALNAEPARQVPLARLVIRLAALALSLAMACLALQVLLAGHYVPDRPPVGTLTPAYYSLMLLMPLAVLLALRWERAGALLIAAGGLALGVLAAWTVAVFEGSVLLILLAGILHAVQYVPFGVMFWRLARQDAGPSALPAPGS